MATDAIDVSFLWSITNGNFIIPASGLTKKFDQTVAGGGGPGGVTIATGGITITLSEWATVGMIFLLNIDPTNFVTYGGATDQPFKMKPGEMGFARLTPGAALKLVADTAACEVYIFIAED